MPRFDTVNTGLGAYPKAINASVRVEGLSATPARQQNTRPRGPRDHSSGNWKYETLIHVRFNATACDRRVRGRSESNDTTEYDAEPSGQFRCRRCARRC